MEISKLKRYFRIGTAVAIIALSIHSIQNLFEGMESALEMEAMAAQLWDAGAHGASTSVTHIMNSAIWSSVVQIFATVVLLVLGILLWTNVCPRVIPWVAFGWLCVMFIISAVVSNICEGAIIELGTNLNAITGMEEMQTYENIARKGLLVGLFADVLVYGFLIGLLTACDVLGSVARRRERMANLSAVLLAPADEKTKTGEKSAEPDLGELRKLVKQIVHETIDEAVARKGK